MPNMRNNSNLKWPWESEAFKPVSKEEFYKTLYADPRDIMPKDIRKNEGIYSVWKVQARGEIDEVFGYTDFENQYYLLRCNGQESQLVPGLDDQVDYQE